MMFTRSSNQYIKEEDVTISNYERISNKTVPEICRVQGRWRLVDMKC